MSELERVVNLLHSTVMSAFSKDACGEVSVGEASSCIRGMLENLGFKVLDLRLFSLEGEEVRTESEASYVRVEASHELSSYLKITHIFTFALLRRRDKLKVVFLQSAIKISDESAPLLSK